ncbi:hypothetical protein SADUNF_Sadunf01G0080000 [Salix dunnii]|uniref:ARID domain-containing protein n=1 Tax=Salix dunnii TaxID=1413687 RepID=A0A835NAW9_9ROSI|nr:hypothetical protein SADUNF_Sadunf01G0080000 [Salix dunnii]
MAGWPILTNGSALDCVDDVINIHKGDGGCCLDIKDDEVKDCIVVDNSDEDDYECEDKVICLFDELVSNFLNEAADGGCIRPIPALLGDGQSLDLFKLFWVVRKRGGFDLVNGFWSFVAKELGLDLQFSPSVKLIYIKYLYELEKCMSRSCKEEKLRKGKRRCDRNLSCSSLELEMQLRSLLLLRCYRKQEDCKFASEVHEKNGRSIEMDTGKSKIGLLDTKAVHRTHNGVGNRNSDNDKKFHAEKNNYFNDSDDDVVILDSSIAKKEFNSRKRKRESLTRMLNWVIQIAKCPDDPSIRVISPQFKWKDHKGNELWLQAIRAREALLQRKHFDPNIEQSLFQVCNMNFQDNQKMHPSVFEDVSVLSEHFAERSRCSKRLPALVKPHSSSSSNSCSPPQSKCTSSLKTRCENGLKEQELGVDLSSKNTTFDGSGDGQVRRHVAVGPLFQAEVPEWTSVASNSDSKWLGTRLWPLECENHNTVVAMDPIGKGRPSVCGCQLPGSVGCVRFHIAEKRIKLKLELGHLFYHWQFDRMGEEVSLRWTTEEEKRFKDMVKFNPLSAGKCFWDNKHKYFPRKPREELVSYYFNSYLVRRRSYQNRVTPKNIDSDNDEAEFGSLSDGYGQEALMVPGAYMLICSENKQCTDFK